MTVHDTPKSWSAHRARRGLLCDVDGTLLDVLANLRRVWDAWSHRYGLDPDAVYGEALRTRPLETFAIVAPAADPLECLAALHELEDEDAREGDYTAFAGAHELLTSVAPTDWALVTSNYEHRVGIRFSRVGLPLPTVIVDAASVAQGKPDPEGFLSAAAALGIRPAECLVLEDAESGVAAARAAGMTVWAVNVDPASPAATSADRAYDRLDLAVDAALTWVRRAPSPGG